MFRTIHTICRTAAAVALTASVAGISASSALGSSAVPSEYATWLAGPRAQVTDGRSPDTIDAAGLSARQYATWLAGPQVRVRDGRSPDTRDAAALAHSPVVTVVEHQGFAWSDFGIGIAVTFGALLLATGLAVATRGARRRPSSAV
jgi:hypothetical protein